MATRLLPHLAMSSVVKVVEAEDVDVVAVEVEEDAEDLTDLENVNSSATLEVIKRTYNKLSISQANLFSWPEIGYGSQVHESSVSLVSSIIFLFQQLLVLHVYP